MIRLCRPKNSILWINFFPQIALQRERWTCAPTCACKRRHCANLPRCMNVCALHAYILSSQWLHKSSRWNQNSHLHHTMAYYGIIYTYLLCQLSYDPSASKSEHSLKNFESLKIRHLLLLVADKNSCWKNEWSYEKRIFAKFSARLHPSFNKREKNNVQVMTKCTRSF